MRKMILAMGLTVFAASKEVISGTLTDSDGRWWTLMDSGGR